MNFSEEMRRKWFIKSSEHLMEHGETISTSKYDQKDWLKIDIPSTIVNGLVVNNELEDPYYGINLKTYPGYKPGLKNVFYDRRYKPSNSPFRFSWWFRKEFLVKENDKSKICQYWLKFKGINYAANIWLNGKRIAGNDYVIGSYRIYDFNVTNFIKRDVNIIAIEIFSPNPDDLCISFVDWSPLPPDDGMGLWQPVTFYSTGSVALKDPFIKCELNIETLGEADITIMSNLVNTQKKRIEIILEGKIEDISFQKALILEPYENKEIKITSEEFPQLKILNPRIWWPYQWGSSELYSLELEVKTNNLVSDSTVLQFGIRDIRSSINEYGSLIFSVNGREFLIRGAAWTPDMMFRQNEEQDNYDVSFIKNLNFNTIRMEGKLATDYFWDLCDREGILVLAGWVCCNHWEKWKNWKQGDLAVAKESLRSQLIRLRNHPSLIAWFYGSDYPPPRIVEKAYLNVLHNTYDDLPNVSSATAAKSELKGETGVKMTGPYTFVPPIYWYLDQRKGAAKGFNTETGPDVCIPPYESLLKFLPPDQQYIGSKVWNFHTGLGGFTNTKIVEEAIWKRYGKTDSFQEFTKIAQVLGYECWRAMFEAHGRNYPEATGVIGWMLNSPWPSLIWQLFDFYNNTNGAYFGSKKACEPFHIQYSYDDSTIWVVNTSIEERENLTAKIRILTLDLEEKFSESIVVNIGEYSKICVITLPKIDDLSSVYFLDLTLKNKSNVISKNFYWLSVKEDVFKEKDEWLYTPLESHADMSSLRNLPKAEIESSYEIIKNDDQLEVLVQIDNISENLAFLLRVYLVNDSSEELIAPVYWNENFISLFPSEKTSIKGIIPKTVKFSKISVKIEGLNI